MSERFELVVVCTGNRFRSPIAEALLRELTAGLPVAVSSYGTLELGPAPVLPEALELAPELGIALDEHRARCVRGASLADADLVLGFEHHHVAAAVVDAGAARGRVFLLPGLVTLLDGLPPPDSPDAVERARARIRLADELRAGADEPQLPDPIGGPRSGFSAAAKEVERLCRLLAARLFA